MKARVFLLIVILGLTSCSKKPEVVEGPLTIELLQRHIVDRGPIRFTGDSRGKLGNMKIPGDEDAYYWKSEEVIEIKEQTSTHAIVLVRVSGHKSRWEKRRGRRGKRRITYGHTSRSATFELSRSSVNDFWKVENTLWVLKLKTGPYVELAKSETLVPIDKPVPAFEEPKPTEPLVESSSPEPPAEPQIEPQEEIKDVTPELNALKTQLASLQSKLVEEGSLDYPDTVILMNGREMECEILEETETSVRIKTESGTAYMPKSRIKSLRQATESEKEKAREAAARNSEIRKQIDEITLKITEIEGANKAAADVRQAPRGHELLDHAKNGHGDLVSHFLEIGMPPDVRDHNQRTPLMLAAFEGHDSIVTALLDAGADLKARDVDGWTALTYAAYGGRTETVRLLIDSGADVNARVNSGQSVLTVARQKNHQDLIQLLLQKGAQ